MKKCAILGFLASLLLPVLGTTLQQLTLPALANQSTSIVRGKFRPSYADLRGSVIYQHYSVQVTEVWKGAVNRQIDVAVPGGVLNGIEQRYSGTPSFLPGQDYIIFLWTSRSGLTQVMGLSQGLFSIATASGVPMVTRAASSEDVLSGAGQTISDTNFSMSLSAFHANITQILGVQGAGN